MNISYHCHNHKDVEKIQKIFYEQGYTFNGYEYKNSYDLTPTSEMDDYIKMLIHIKHDTKDMGYDYYYLEHPKKLQMISKDRIVVDCNVLFKKYREEKLKRILK